SPEPVCVAAVADRRGPRRHRGARLEDRRPLGRLLSPRRAERCLARRPRRHQERHLGTVLSTGNQHPLLRLCGAGFVARSTKNAMMPSLTRRAGVALLFILCTSFAAAGPLDEMSLERWKLLKETERFQLTAAERLYRESQW